MNSILKYGCVQGNPLYSCIVPLRNVSIPGLERPLLGYGMILFGIIIEIIYIPALIAIITKQLMRFSCYKIMFCLGLVDMLATFICTIFGGFLFVDGAVFCTYPTINYIAGCFALGVWITSCAFTLLLVINRVTDIIFPKFAIFIFAKNRAWLACLLVLLYGAYGVCFTPPILFNSKIMAWIGDPGIISQVSPEFQNYLQITNNCVFLVTSISFYTLYCVFMNKQKSGVKVSCGKHIFIQSSLICLINGSAAFFYTLIMFIEPNPYIVIIGELSWSMVHGFPAIIYITMNHTVRSEVFRLCQFSEIKISEISITRNRTIDL